MENKGSIEYNIFEIRNNPFDELMPTEKEEYQDDYYLTTQDSTLKVRTKNKNKKIKLKKLLYTDESNLDHFVNIDLSPNSLIDKKYLESLNYDKFLKNDSDKIQVMKKRLIYKLEGGVFAEFSNLFFSNKHINNLVLSGEKSKNIEYVLRKYKLDNYKNTSFMNFLKNEY